MVEEQGSDPRCVGHRLDTCGLGQAPGCPAWVSGLRSEKQGCAPRGEAAQGRCVRRGPRPAHHQAASAGPSGLFYPVLPVLRRGGPPMAPNRGTARSWASPGILRGRSGSSSPRFPRAGRHGHFAVRRPFLRPDLGLSPPPGPGYGRPKTPSTAQLQGAAPAGGRLLPSAPLPLPLPLPARPPWRAARPRLAPRSLPRAPSPAGPTASPRALPLLPPERPHGGARSKPGEGGDCARVPP